MNIVESQHDQAKPPGRTLAQRIWQYKLHYLMVIPAFMLILVLKVWPFLAGLYTSFLDYKVFMGISGSPWIGWDNYKNVFQMPEFRSALMNTLSYKTWYILIGGLLAFVAALALSGIRSGRLRGWVSTLLVLPYVLPSVVLGHFAMLMFSASSSPFGTMDRLFLGEETSFRFIMLALELLKYGAIPTIVAVAAIAGTHARFADSRGERSYWHLNALPAARVVTALMLLQLAVFATTDFELLHTLINPLVAHSAGTIDYFIYQTGFIQGNFNTALAASFITFAIQLALALAAYFLVRGTWFHTLFQRDADIAANLKGGSQAAGAVVGAVGTGIVLVVLYFIMADPFLRPSSANVPLTDVLSLPRAGLAVVLYGLATLSGMFVTVTLAYPMTARRLPGGSLYRLVLIAVMGIGTGTVYEYIHVHSLGMVNTIFPPMLAGFVPIVSAFALKGIFNGKHGHLKEQAELEGRGELAFFFAVFIPRIWKALLALGALQFIVLWNSYMPSLLYISNPSLQFGMMQLVSMLHANEYYGLERGDPMVYRVGALLSLPPLVLFVLLRKWIVSEVLIGGLFKR